MSSSFGTSEGKPGQVDDLATLSLLDDPVLLAHLNARYDADKIYVWETSIVELIPIHQCLPLNHSIDLCG